MASDNDKIAYYERMRQRFNSLKLKLWQHNDDYLGREDNRQLVSFIEKLLDPTYCPLCDSCGDVGRPGEACHHPKQCLFLDAHQGAYDDLLKENQVMRDCMLHTIELLRSKYYTHEGKNDMGAKLLEVVLKGRS